MKEPVRVLHIVTTMNRGGLETMIMNYYRNIDRSEIQFDFLVHRYEKSDYDEEIEELGGRIYHIQPLNPFSMSYRKAMDRFFREHHYSIVHCHLDCMSSVPLKYAKKNGIPVRIAHSHSSNQDKNLKYIVKNIYKRDIKNEATHLFACGYEAGRWMFNTDDFTVMNNAIDTRKFLFDRNSGEKMRKKLNLEDKFIIGHVGRFNEPKNHKFIIEILYEMVKINRNVHLLLVGSGNLERSIREMVNNLSLNDYVTFYGPSDKVNELLQAVDVFLFPSLYEGLPVTMVEAQASGLKCFISDRVPQECIISDNVEMVGLDKDARIWAEKISVYSEGYDRRNMLNDITDHHFDIQENSKWLEEFYINEYNRCK